MSRGQSTSRVLWVLSGQLGHKELRVQAASLVPPDQAGLLGESVLPDCKASRVPQGRAEHRVQRACRVRLAHKV